MAKTVQKKKKVENRIKKSNSSTNPDRVSGSAAGGKNMRDKTTIKRLLMYRGGKPKRNRDGKIVRPAVFQGNLPSGSMARVEPNRRWFGNTRVVTQNALQTFQDEMGKVVKDPYQVVMRQSKLPLSLLHDRAKTARVHLLDTESFETTFGKKAQRKKPSLKVADYQGLMSVVQESTDKYDEEKDKDLEMEDEGFRDEAREPIFSKGTSRRIWGELYKVIDSSDVVIQVLDARNPMGTRSKHIEDFMTKEKSYKHLIFVLNKCDLVPTWVTQRWVTLLSAEFPTLAMHASVTNPFGKGALIQLLRQFGKLHQDKKQISVGLIGYPNVGKSSIINTLRGKKVCNVAPIAGETKVWQYITLMKRIYLIDCPGVVYPSETETETELVLKGVVRVENVKLPEYHIPAVLKRVKGEYLTKTYKLPVWDGPTDFLENMARRTGKLLKGGEPDVSTVAKMVLNDFQRGRLPYFVKPPGADLEIQKPSKSTESSSQPLIKFVPAAGEAEEESTCATTSEPETSTETEQQDVTTSPQEEGPGLTNKEKRLQMKVAKQEKLDRRQPRVAQDLSKIVVGLDFSGDDVQPLEPQSPGVVSTMSGYSADQSYVSEDDLGRDDGPGDEEEEEGDLQPEEEENQSGVSNESEDDAQDSNQDESSAEPQKNDSSSQLGEEVEVEDRKSKQDSATRDPSNERQNKTLSATSSQPKKGDVKDRQSLASQYIEKSPVSKKVRKAMKRKLTQMSTSGKWVASAVSEASASTPVASTSGWKVQSTPGQADGGSMESGRASSPSMNMPPSDTQLLQAPDNYAVKVSPHVFCVEATPSPSKKSKTTENVAVEQSEKKKKLTAKQRRSLERAQKTKKVGTHYYQEVNVKNKNRNKKRDMPGKKAKKGRK
ncbi:GNL2 [Branchiostoma lanceolatum]|uniref:Nucleolar GTP-binding protein 2 n=1 Tax=Branchiostoma lanceolatum TaxID=7740 RepID=A0A8K0EI19_BRALA|nr:GNL2 [Branchiostoma lanceolatum]